MYNYNVVYQYTNLKQQIVYTLSIEYTFFNLTNTMFQIYINTSLYFTIIFKNLTVLKRTFENANKNNYTK